MKPTYKGWAQSSQNPEEISNSIKGFILGISSIIVLAAQAFFHISLTAGDVGGLATELGAVGGAIWTIYGAIMKVVVFFAKEK